MEDFFEWSAEGSSVSLILIRWQMNLSRICHELTGVTRDTCHIPSCDQRCVKQSLGSGMAYRNKTSLLFLCSYCPSCDQGKYLRLTES